MSTQLSPRLRVIGYGNELRGDDGVGPAVALAVERRGLRGVEVMVVHQLLPELADAVAGADAVVFVDAAVSKGDPTEGVELRPLEGVTSGGMDWTGHFGTPLGILSLAQEVHGLRPPAWVVAVPGERFGWGPGMSPMAWHGIGCAIVEIVRWHGLWMKGAATGRRSGTTEPDGRVAVEESCTRPD